MSYMGKREKAPLCYGRFSFKKCACRKFFFPCRIWAKGKKRHFVTAGFPLRSARAGNVSCHVVYGQKGKSATLLRQIILQEVLVPETSLSMSYMGKGEKAPLCYGRFSFKKCARRKFILPCRIGKESATLLRQIFLQEVLVPEIFLSMSYMGKRDKAPLCYGRFSFKKCARRKCILPCRIGKKAPLCYGRFSFKKCSCRKVFLTMSYMGKREKAPLCYGRFSFKKCARRKCILPCRIRKQSATLLRQIFLQEVLVPESFFNHVYGQKGKSATLLRQIFLQEVLAPESFFNHVVYGQKGKSATLLRQVFLQEVLVPEIFLSMSYMGKREKAPLCYSRFSFKKCSCRKFSFPCRIWAKGKKRHFVTAGFPLRSARAGNVSCHVVYGQKGKSATLLRQIFLQKVLVPEIFLCMSYMGKREKRPFVTAGFPLRSARAGSLSCHVV